MSFYNVHLRYGDVPLVQMRPPANVIICDYRRRLILYHKSQSDIRMGTHCSVTVNERLRVFISDPRLNRARLIRSLFTL